MKNIRQLVSLIYANKSKFALIGEVRLADNLSNIMSLYRKYRPQKFSDLYGQEHIVKVITNSIGSGKFSHAYIFSGPKGSGKTTTARLLAKALNCVGRETGTEQFEPCNKCVSCREISLGGNLDMIEIDAASNRGIDEIRELRDKIRFAPTSSRYKIYIIDECHMLTKEAFNALLKTLEEPPAHAIFILATTEIHKVPATIISRTQNFEFRNGSQEEIFKLLKKVVGAEKIEIDDESLRLIARLSGGAFRDALSMLEQVGAQKKKIEIKEAEQILGQVTEEYVWQYLNAIVTGEIGVALKIIERIYNDGKNLEDFISKVIVKLRQLILIKENLDLKFELNNADQEKIEKIAENTSTQDIVKIIEILSEAMPKVKTSILGQLPLEMATFNIIKGIRNTKEYENTKPSNTETQNEEEARKDSETPKKDIPITNDQGSMICDTNQNTITNNLSTSFSPDLWSEVVKEIKKHNNAIAAMVGNTQFVETTDHHIVLAAKFKFHAEQICTKKNLTIIESAVQKVCGKPYKIECVVDNDLQIKKPKEAEEELLDSAQEIFSI